MLKKLRWLVGRNHRSWSPKSLASDASHHVQVASVPETLHEVAIYIHRFHNLDLFQQGWYQIKISMRLDGSESTSLGTPARVVQYEAPVPGSQGAYGVWMIDDAENSFSTQPFWIKYARQDIYLSIMISFFLSLEGLLTSSVIVKFELMYSPALANGSESQAFLNACPASTHEFRIPPRALLGSHSYCPVHFDAFHAVLVDLSVHISMLRASYTPCPKESSEAASEKSQQIMLIKALQAARDILIDDLQKISKAINHAIDLTSFMSNMDETKFGSALQLNMEVDKASDISYKPQNCVKDDLADYSRFLGDQIMFLWNIFLVFHRANRTKILEYLRDAWADDRRAEWSIWMVYSKIEKSRHHNGSRVQTSCINGLHGKSQSLVKFDDDSAQSASMRAELHRQSIAQMKINGRSLQDMHIFGDPLHVPIVIVERVTIVPQHPHNENSCVSHLDSRDTRQTLNSIEFGDAKAAKGSCLQKNDRILKIVVFVHGFQGHHLDLRLVRNQWLLIDPKIEFLMSEANEEKTDGDFREMGLRLAEEVITFTKKKMDKASRTGNLRNIKLSFVGHSIGNIIIRAALAESIMEPYLRFLYTYISVSGPHLGYMYSSNSLFNSGLWLLKKFKGLQCIHQLTFSDDPDLQNTFLYKLCMQKTLDNFRNIILLSSPQDGYIPYHSARIEMCTASLLDYSKRGKVFWEMLNECLHQIHAPSTETRTFMRCDVNFDESSHGRNLNTFIGRAAHVEFLECDFFARLIMWSFPEVFR